MAALIEGRSWFILPGIFHQWQSSLGSEYSINYHNFPISYPKFLRGSNSQEIPSELPYLLFFHTMQAIRL